MKNWIKLFPLFIAVLGYSQKTFTIEEAWKYAQDNNVNVQKAKIDQTIAKQKVKETIGIGLPQISGNAGYNYFLKIPVTLLPAEIAGGMPGTYIPVKFGQKQSLTSGLTLRQLLFDGSYFVGLEASKTYKEASNLAEEKTEISVKEGILMAYTAVLVTDENLKTLEDNRKVAAKSLFETKETYKVGLIELQNVEQQEYGYKSLIANQENLVRTRQKLLMTLKYLMGYPLEEPIELTNSLEELVQKNESLVDLDKNKNISDHIDLRLSKNALRVSELKLKLQKSRSLPTLSAALSSTYNGYADSFNFFNKNQQYFNTSVVSVSLDVPIFSGLQRHWQTEQAKLDVEKAKLDLSDKQRDLQTQVFSAATDYDNAFNSYKNAQELITLSTSIYNKQQIKFKEGLGTSLELQQSETQLYDSQAKYYQAAMNLIQAKIKLDEAEGKL